MCRYNRVQTSIITVTVAERFQIEYIPHFPIILLFFQINPKKLHHTVIFTSAIESEVFFELNSEKCTIRKCYINKCKEYGNKMRQRHNHHYFYHQMCRCWHIMSVFFKFREQFFRQTNSSKMSFTITCNCRFLLLIGSLRISTHFLMRCGNFVFVLKQVIKTK